MTARSILITGCSSGIGYDAAHGLRAQGWRVFAACRQEADCQRLRDEGFESPKLDYSDPDSIQSALNEVLAATGGRLDALFNNGAYAVPGAAEDLPTGALREIFEVNVLGWHDLTRLVIPVMRAQGHGRIVNHGSVLGLVVAPWRAAYNASKFAVEGLTDTLRIEMRDTPIHIITFNTGPVTSKIRVNSIPHFERWIDWRSSPRAAQYESRLLRRLYEDRGPDTFELPPSAVTAKLVHALESARPRPRYYVTKATWIMGLLRRVLPTTAMDWLTAKG
ncbi:SDR family NAD(P)-dependent oxidoreductase [Mameliella sediminis]|uniref:SDR family NAD(P)-dependent oxidoreductase n=1 Tax=Mameliella sediminis TaxID=2836866 RepID=UPI001C464031|nr:SDR family NAD(P)-dependent oxidoreductase [Mameliella sediminis]MBV7397462.1 SDR family NAD(P)-dependent oxidoreductase [Mameliella sediminis]